MSLDSGETVDDAPIMLTRIYADEAGESHFDDIALPTEVSVYGSAESLSAIAKQIPATGLIIREVRDEGPVSGVWHCTPQRGLKFFPSGLCEVEASDGEVRRFGPEAALFLLGEDNHGKGHLFRGLAGPRHTVFIDVPDDWRP